MASIREVAKLAGVSAATVSRVMNGTANVDEEKRRRVLDAIEKTGFRPNELARALFKKSSRIIGMIVPDIENPFFSELAKAVEETAYLSGYRILFCNSDDDPEKENMNIQMLAQMNADGLIITTNCDSTSRVLVEKALVNQVETQVELCQDVEAPVEPGQKLGQITVTAQGTTLATVPLVACQGVERLSVPGLFARLLQHLFMAG